MAKDIKPIRSVIEAEREATKQIREMEAAREEIRDAIKRYMGDEQEGEMDGVVLIRHVPTEGFAKSKFAKAFPDLARQATRVVKKEELDLELLRRIAPDEYQKFLIWRFTNAS
jgi:hypothetical protein